jgi:hypothetical protein
MSDRIAERRALFENARAGFEPTEPDRARTPRAVAKRLGIAAGTLATATTAAGSSIASGAAAGTPALLVATKWVAVAALVSAVGVGSVSAYRAATPAHDLSVRPRREAVQAKGEGATNSTPVPIAAAREGASAAREVPEASSAAPVSSARETIHASAGPASETLPLRPGVKASGTSARAAALADESVGSATPPTPESTPSASGSPVAAETRLVSGAVEALRAGDAARALALLDEHARAFPHGILAEERSAERVSALCKLGRLDEAAAEANRFLTTSPDSPLAGRVRASCGGAPVGPLQP